MITDSEAKTLTLAREILKRLANTIEEHSYEGGVGHAYRCGLVASACSAAEDGIFQALNSLNAYLHSPAAERALHPETPATVPLAYSSEEIAEVRKA